MPEGNHDADVPPGSAALTFAGISAILLLLVGSVALMCWGEDARGHRGREAQYPPAGEPEPEPAELLLEPGERLLGAGVTCPIGGACRIWTLTRDLEPGERPRRYALTHGDERIRLIETPPEHGG